MLIHELQKNVHFLLFIEIDIYLVHLMQIVHFLCCLEIARDSAVGRERILVVPSSLALDSTPTNQHVAGAQNELNQQILEVSFLPNRMY